MNVRLLCFFVLTLHGALSLNAAELVEVKPLTSRILMLRFDDGFVRHHRRGEIRDSEQAVVARLDLIKAMLKTSYTLFSEQDINFSSPTHPVDLGRKSKPTEFALLCQQYNNGCLNSDPDHAMEHWIYLILPQPLQQGKSYKLALDGLSQNLNEVTFVYDETELHSEAIHVNNLGYAPAAPAKFAYLYHWMGDKGGLDLSAYNGKAFKVYNVESKQFVFEGKIAFRRSASQSETGQATDTPNRNFSSADVYECNFSAFNTPGNYKIVVEGIGSSFPFSVDDDAYFEAFYWTMKGLYQNRSGIALEKPYAQFSRPAPHNPAVTPGFANRLKYSTFRTFDLSNYDGGEPDKAKIEAQYKGTLTKTFGWYQDAGDWDGYYTHSHVPAYLLFLYESGKSKFADGELQIPESGNGIPDVLDEAAWLLRYFKRAKDEVKEKGWGTGGVPGARVFGDLWGADAPGNVGQGSWEDTNRDWYLLGEDPWTTYKYAGLAAHMAFILEGEGLSDPNNVNWKQEAIDAYTWARDNTKPSDENLTSGYELKDMRLYAAAALYRLTGEWSYHSIVTSTIAPIQILSMDKQDQLFGVWMYFLSGNQPRDEQTLEHARELLLESGDRYLGSADSRSMRWGGDFNFPMLVGQGSTPLVTPGVFAYLAARENLPRATKYLGQLHTTADYFLGTNPLNITWISGVGERYPTGIFHLDWWYFDKEDTNNREPVIKGVVPYGPWRFEDLGALGWWNPNWAYSDRDGNPRIYPTQVNTWPGHERWFDMRVSPLGGEFTIHQNTVISAFVYGFLTKGPVSEIREGIVTHTEALTGEHAEAVQIYPVPAKDRFRIVSHDMDIAGLEITTIEGKTIKRMPVAKEIREFELDVTGVANGIYLIKILRVNNITLVKRVKISR